MSATWKEIYDTAQAAGFHQGVMNAEVNAHTTVYEEKSVPASEFDRIALSTLSEYLASDMLDADEHAFFVSLGIRF